MIKLGYNNDPMKLEHAFHGIITQVNTGDTIEIVAQGHGAELTNPISPPEGLDFKWNSLAKAHGDIIRVVLDNTPGLEHFGKKNIFKFMLRESEDGGNIKSLDDDPRRPGYLRWQGGILRFILPNSLEGLADLIEMDTPLDDNIYMEFIGNMNPFYHMTFDWFIEPGKSAWESIQDMLMLYPNYICKVLPYNHTYNPVCTDIRSTLYIGPKDGYYKYTDDPHSIATLKEFKGSKTEEQYAKEWLTSNRPETIRAYFTELVQELNILANKYKETSFLKNTFIGFLTIEDFGKRFPRFRNLSRVIADWIDIIQTNINKRAIVTTAINWTRGKKRGIVESTLICSWTVDDWLELYYHGTRRTGKIHIANTASLARFFDVIGGLGSGGFFEAIQEMSKLEFKQPGIDQLQKAVKRDLGTNQQHLANRMMKKVDTTSAYSYFKDNPWYSKVTRTHIVDSMHHIIANNITASADNMYNRVILGFTNEPVRSKDGTADLDDIRSIEVTANPSINPDVIRSYQTSHNNLDTNWYDDFASAKMVSKKNIPGLTWNHVPSYFRVANKSLADKMRGMYTGDIMVLGNPKIRAWDKVYINDQVNGMHGMIEVDTVIHRFDAETGFTTTITPMLNVAMRDINSMIDDSYTTKVLDQALWKGYKGGFKWATGVGLPLLGLGTIFGGATSAVIGAAGAGVLLPVAAAFTIFFGARGYISYGDFIIDRVGRMLTTEPVALSPLTYHGKPYTAGLEGYRHDNMTGHIQTMLRDMSIIDRIAHIDGADSVIRSLGENKDTGEIFIDELFNKVFYSITPFFGKRLNVGRFLRGQ